MERVNPFDDVEIAQQSFAYADLIGRDKWQSFSTAFTGLTVVGAATSSGRFRIVGKSAEFQAQLSAATSISSTAGVTYMTLPISAKGLAGFGAMTNMSASTTVGLCHIDVISSRCYTPTQAASANTFTIFGQYEI